MTPTQMLRRLNRPAPQSVGDYAQGCSLTAYECIKYKLCPICGKQGHNEHYYGDHPQSFFFCGASRQHIFEFDHDAEFADRVPM